MYVHMYVGLCACTSCCNRVTYMYMYITNMDAYMYNVQSYDVILSIESDSYMYMYISAPDPMPGRTERVMVSKGVVRTE